MNEREIFMAALDRESPDERTRYLGQACGNDRELRRRVDALLQSYADSGSFLERPVLADEATLGLDSITDRAGPPPRADDQADLPDPNSDPVSLDFLQPSDAPDSLGRLGQYEVRAVVGVGGMGVVLRAHDPKLNRIVAVKVMAPQFVVNPTARKRFLREAQAIAAVTHPHVIAIHAVDQTEKTPYLVMEFIDGLSLEEKIDRCGHLEVKEILRIGAQIAAGLAAAHAHGLVHRDIKPSNILLENGVERVRITDFGLARAVDDVGVTRSGDVTGTPQFMSPEQAQGKPVDHRSDLFSLGAVLYTMCTGRSPFRAETTVAVLRRVCDDVPRPIHEVNPDIPEQLVAIIDRLLAKDPEERFQTAQEVSDLLMGYLAHLQDPASTPPPEPLSVRPATDRKTRAAGAAPVGRWPRRALDARRDGAAGALCLRGRDRSHRRYASGGRHLADRDRRRHAGRRGGRPAGEHHHRRRGPGHHRGGPAGSPPQAGPIPGASGQGRPGREAGVGHHRARRPTGPPSCPGTAHDATGQGGPNDSPLQPLVEGRARSNALTNCPSRSRPIHGRPVSWKSAVRLHPPGAVRRGGPRLRNGPCRRQLRNPALDGL